MRRRPDARVRRSAVHADPRRSRRRRDQGGAAGRRRDAWSRSAVRRDRERGVLLGAESREARDQPGSQRSGRARSSRTHVANADVLVENFIPGTMERWGLGYEDSLASKFPRLVYCSISGFGADGPLGGLPGYDAVLQAMCGLMSVNGDTQSGPTRMGIPLVDHLTGYMALNGMLMALRVRDQTGRGQRVEATLFDTALSMLIPQAANWLCIRARRPACWAARTQHRAIRQVRRQRWRDLHWHPERQPIQAILRSYRLPGTERRPALWVQFTSASEQRGVEEGNRARATRRFRRLTVRSLDEGQRAGRRRQLRAAGDRPTAMRNTGRCSSNATVTRASVRPRDYTEHPPRPGAGRPPSPRIPWLCSEGTWDTAMRTLHGCNVPAPCRPSGAVLPGLPHAQAHKKTLDAGEFNHVSVSRHRPQQHEGPGRAREIRGTGTAFAAREMEILAAKTGRFEVLEGGETAEAVVVMRFPTWDDALAWYRSDAYQKALPHRQAAASYRAYLVEGVS